MVVPASAGRRGERRRVQQRHGTLPSAAKHLHERRRGENGDAALATGESRLRSRRSSSAGADPRARGAARRRWRTNAPSGKPETSASWRRWPRVRGIDPLTVQPRVDRVDPGPLRRVQLVPKCHKGAVVLTAAEGAGAMAGRERRSLVQEEQLREPPRLQEALPSPAAKLEPARDPALRCEATNDRPVHVVQAAAVPVDEPSSRVGDELAERRHSVLQRHSGREYPHRDDRRALLGRFPGNR